MPYVVPPAANSAIRIGIIHRSRPFIRSMAAVMPVLMAPVRFTTPRNPPMISTNSDTSMAFAA